MVRPTSTIDGRRCHARLDHRGRGARRPLRRNPRADAAAWTYTYDAWNRQVSAAHSGPDTVTYGYDALGRRITRTEASTTTDFYYSNQQQVLEEDVSGIPQAQYVWSAAYVDALVLRDRYNANDPSTHNYGKTNSGLNERLYADQDVRWNTRTVFDAGGTVKERYVVDPLGGVTVLNPDWTYATGDAYAMVYLYKGGRSDPATGLVNFRARDYSPVLDTWVETDPMGYIDGMSLYTPFGGDPTGMVDPMGTQASCGSGPTSVALAVGAPSAESGSVVGSFFDGIWQGVKKVGRALEKTKEGIDATFKELLVTGAYDLGLISPEKMLEESKLAQKAGADGVAGKSGWSTTGDIVKDTALAPYYKGNQIYYQWEAGDPSGAIIEGGLFGLEVAGGAKLMQGRPTAPRMPSPQQNLPPGFIKIGPNKWMTTIEIDIPNTTPGRGLGPYDPPPVGPGPGRGPLGPLDPPPDWRWPLGPQNAN